MVKYSLSLMETKVLYQSFLLILSPLEQLVKWRPVILIILIKQTYNGHTYVN